MTAARPLPLWIADQVRNDVTMRCIVERCWVKCGVTVNVVVLFAVVVV